MMSISACRMGLVSTTNRKLGAPATLKSVAGHVRRPFVTAQPGSSSKPAASSSLALPVEMKDIWTPRRLLASSFSGSSSPIRRRWKSTMSSAVYEDSDSDDDQQHSLETRTQGLAAAAEMRAADSDANNARASHEEAWMINLGRGNDNEWLTGPREDAWYTGVHPRDCPGTWMLICVVLLFSHCVCYTAWLWLVLDVFAWRCFKSSHDLHNLIAVQYNTIQYNNNNNNNNNK